MKKALSIILSLALILSISACTTNNSVTPVETPEPTATPEPSKKGIDLLTLGEYTIVYPEDYSEWKMTEVNLLKDVIKHITGAEICAVPDTEKPDGKLIILGSSSINNKFSDTIDGFANAMCYVVGSDEDNIVLGGKNYYSDMRAIYDFINNDLGYDDLNDEYVKVSLDLKDDRVVLWEQPTLHIMGSNFSCGPFQKASQVKDFADCNFNLLHIQVSSHINEKYDKGADLRDVAKWCARFGVESVIQPQYLKADGTPKNYTADNFSVNIPFEDDIVENPAIYGLYVTDEPEDSKVSTFSAISKYLKDKYSPLRWKLYVNIFIPWYPEIPEEEMFGKLALWEENFTMLDLLSYDGYLQNFTNRNMPFCYILQRCSSFARKLGQGFGYYVESYNLKNKTKNNEYNVSKGFRTNSYLALCFGSDMIEYFQYGDHFPYYNEPDNVGGALVTKDFEIVHEFYDVAQRVNGELEKVGNILNDYEFVGTFTDDPNEDNITVLAEQYPEISDVFTVNKNDDNALVFGIYKSKTGNGYAVVMVNINELDDYDYDLTKRNGMAFLSFNTGNVKCYVDGEECELFNMKDHIYEVPCGNGSCCLITIE